MNNTEFENIEMSEVQINPRSCNGLDLEIVNNRARGEQEENLVDETDHPLHSDQEEVQHAQINLGLDRMRKIVQNLVKSATEAFRRLNPTTANSPSLEVNRILEDDEEGGSLKTSSRLAKINFPSNPDLEYMASNCFPSLPNKEEEFVEGYEIELKRPVKIFLLVTVILKIIPKFLCFWFVIIFETTFSSVHRQVILGILAAFLVFDPIFRLGCSHIKRHLQIGFGAYLIDTILMSLLYAYVVSDIGEAALNLVFANLAGDVILILNIVKKEVLSSGRVFMTKFIIFMAGFFFFALQMLAFEDIPLGSYFVLASLVGVILSSLAAKEVLILKERLEDVDHPIRLGDCFYHAITARKSVFFRQLFLAYSKIFSE